MAEAGKHIKKTIAILFAAIIIGYLLLVLVYLIPTDRMYPNVISTAKMMETSDTSQKDPYSGKLIDNYADSLTVLMASYPGQENAFEKAACSYYNFIDGEYPRESLVGITLHNEDYIRMAYGRYWHGSMIFIKPLLLFFDLSAMRLVNTGVLFILIIVLMLILQRTLAEATLPFVLMMLLFAPTTVGQCFEYTFAVHIMLIASIVYLWNPSKILSGDRIIFLFLITGIALAYFDFLTAPTITVTVPLALYCMKERPSWKKLLLCVVFWFTGYAGMWAGKWIIALASNGSSLTSLTDHFALWTSENPVSGVQISRVGALNRNFEKVFENIYIDIAMLCYVVAIVFHGIKNRKMISSARIDRFLLLLIPGIIGIMWILLMARHSYVHAFFTYRTLVPSVFCVLCMLDLGDITGKGAIKRGEVP